MPAPEPVVAPAPAAVAVTPTTPKTVVSTESIKESVLKLVSEKTGYPQDMLALDLDLEADLGVDTVKQAEVMATIREVYGIKRDDTIKLRDFPTLNHILRFVEERRTDIAGAAPASQTPAPAQTKVEKEEMTPQQQVAVAPADAPGERVAAPVTDEQIKERILALVVEKTGYPQEMLDLDLDLEADLGVDTVKQAELLAAIREIYGIPRDPNLKLRDFPTLKHVIQFACDRRTDVNAAPAPVPAQVVEQPAPSAAAGVVETPQAAPAAAAPQTPAPTVEEIKERILALVVEKTGYPQEMLDLDLDLEADLGVDTVKQAELLAAIREIYGIPRDPNLKLRDFPTLKHVIQFACDRRTGVNAAAPAPELPAPAPATVVVETPQAAPVATPVAPTVTVDEIKERILALVVEKTGYPQEMLDLDLDLEADLGVDTVKQAELLAAIREIYGIPRDPNLKLRDFPTLKHVIQFACDRCPQANAAPVAAPVAEQPSPASAAVVVETAPAPTSVAPTVTAEEIKDRILALVVEKTGYPREMLDLDLDLEADLGVDTVKQAELLAAIREIYSIPRDPNLKLRDFPTLKHVIQFACDRCTDAKPATVTAAVPAAAPVAENPVALAPVALARQAARQPHVPPATLANFEAADRIPRRVPTPVLRPPLAMCKPTGVTLGPGRRVIIMPDKAGVADVLTQKLQAMGVEVLRIDTALDLDALTACLASWVAVGPVQGVYWLPALDHEGRIADMDLGGWHEALRLRLKSFYTSMRALYEQIVAPGTFLVSATLLGGQHGYDEAGAVAPMGGAVAGFTKTYKREHTDALVKVVDFEANRTPADIAGVLVNETLADPGAVEIGYKADVRWTIGLSEKSPADGKLGLTLDENTTFVITGAAGSIVSAITTDLAAASGGTFYLLDLVPKPDPNNTDIERFVTDKDGLKRDLFKRMQERGERATPALIERELAGLERAHAAKSAIDAVHNGRRHRALLQREPHRC